MKPEIHFPESAKDERRWERQFDDKPKTAPASEPQPVAEKVIPGKYRWRKPPRTRKPASSTPQPVRLNVYHEDDDEMWERRMKVDGL